MTAPQVRGDSLPTASAAADLSGLVIDRGSASRRKGRMRRIMFRLVVLSVIGGVGYAAWMWYKAAPLAVETAAVSSAYPSQALTLLNATGYVIPQRKASVASKATGRLEWLGVLEGSKVRAGEVIARLENRDTQAMRDVAAANVQVAEANRGQAKAELAEAELVFRRAQSLAAKQLVSDSDLDSVVARLGKAQAALAGYEAAIAVANANLRAAEVSLDQTLIRAPFDGVVLTRNANVGDTITPFSQAVDTKGAVVTIADMNTLEVEADVAESSYLSVKAGQPVEIQLDAIPGERFEGVVSRMVPTVDRAKASTLVKISLVRQDPRILPDMSARVAFLQREVTEAERQPVLTIPAAAVVEGGGRQQVYVVEDGKARLQPVELGEKIADQIAVRGLVAGTRVVVRPPEGLLSGQPVKEESK